MVEKLEQTIDKTEVERWLEWKPEKGYFKKEDIANEIPNITADDGAFKYEKLPRRSVAPGVLAGLTLLLNVDKEEYYCSGTTGFRARITFFYIF